MELAKLNPILLKEALKRTLRAPLLESCPLKKHECKNNISSTTHTVNEELDACAQCYTEYLINKSEIRKDQCQ